MQKLLPCSQKFDRLTRCLAAGLGIVLLVPACRCASEPQPEVQAPSASAAAPPRCQPVYPGSSFTIPALGPGVAEADERLSPFAVELGGAVRVGDGFAVTYTRSDSKQSHAGVAWLDAKAGQGEVVDLSEIRGDAAPPKAAPQGEGLVLAALDSDAAGGALRLANVSRGQPARWGAELDLGVDDSLAFDLAVVGQRGLLVWDEWDKASNKSYVALSAFDSSKLEDAGAAVRISPAQVDAESPRLSAGKAGFWLAWLAFGRAEAALGGAGGAGAESYDELVEVRPSTIQLQRLDEVGRAQNAPLEVTKPGGYVAGFDLIAGHDGSVVVVWRAARSSPGIQGGVINISRIKADGSVDEQFVEDEDVGAGVPAFLFDPNPSGGAPHGWLVLDSASGLTRFAALSPFGQQLEQLESDDLISASSLLSAFGGALLVAEGRGRNSVLSLVRCGDGTPLTPEPATTD